MIIFKFLRPYVFFISLCVYELVCLFLQSTGYKFDASLSKNQRALVHQMARKMGLKSKSFG